MAALGLGGLGEKIPEVFGPSTCWESRLGAGEHPKCGEQGQGPGILTDFYYLLLFLLLFCYFWLNSSAWLSGNHPGWKSPIPNPEH